jgi:hypothetical protein
MAWPRRNAPILLLGVALLAAGTLLLALGSGLTFFQDTWAFLMDRRAFDAHAFLAPHNEHIVLVPVAIQKLLLALFGMTSAASERVVLTALLLATAVLLFAYVRRRLGPWPALLAAVLVLFLGPAWQVLLWPFEIGYVGALLFGIAMLLALDREDERGDLAACAFLVVAVGFSTLGLVFAAAAAVDVLLARRERGLRRAYLVAVPLLLYLAWYAGWGHTAESHVTADNVLRSPVFVFDGLSSSLAALLALGGAGIDREGVPLLGRLLLGVLVVGFAVAAARGWRPSAGVLPVATANAVFWLLAAFNQIPGREAYASRYMYAGGVLLLLLAASLLRGVRIGRPALAVGGAVAAVAVALNTITLVDGRDWLREQTVLTRSDLAAIEIARATVDPQFALLPAIAGTSSLIDIEAGKYLEAASEYGSPAYTQAELAAAPEQGREQADIVLSQALPLATESGVEAGGSRAGCATVPPGDDEREVPLDLRPGVTRIEVPPGDDAEVSLRRYADDDFPVPTEGAPAGEVTVLEIPADESSRPWRMEVEADQPVRVCPG